MKKNPRIYLEKNPENTFKKTDIQNNFKGPNQT